MALWLARHVYHVQNAVLVTPLLIKRALVRTDGRQARVNVRSLPDHYVWHTVWLLVYTSIQATAGTRVWPCTACRNPPVWAYVYRKINVTYISSNVSGAERIIRRKKEQRGQLGGRLHKHDHGNRLKEASPKTKETKESKQTAKIALRRCLASMPPPTVWVDLIGCRKEKCLSVFQK
jgi:hypothetical protein